MEWEQLYRELQAAADRLSRTVGVNRKLQVFAFGTQFADALLDLRTMLGPDHFEEVGGDR